MNLKECPFCGGKAQLNLSPNNIWWVDCKTCCASGPTNHDKEEAIILWNKRYSTEVCPGCGSASPLHSRNCAFIREEPEKG